MRKGAGLLVAAIATVLVVAGCSGAPSQTSSSTTGAPTAQSTTTAPPGLGHSTVTAPATTATSATTTAPPPRQPPVSSLPHQFSTTDPDSPWVLVNKMNPLVPATYAPQDLVTPAVAQSGGIQLRAEAAHAIEAMFSAAATQGTPLTLLSGYRSYATQTQLYAQYAAASGTALADTYSARAGYSEHQTGLALDIGAANGACPLQYCFVQTPAAVWAAANAYKFGFILRYQLGHNNVTGYYAESWHYRFVGTELASDMRNKGSFTLEEYLGQPAAPTYP